MGNSRGTKKEMSMRNKVRNSVYSKSAEKHFREDKKIACIKY